MIKKIKNIRFLTQPRLIIIIFIGLTCQYNTLLSQFSVTSGYNLMFPNIRGYSLFIDSYNDYHKNDLDSQLKKFKPGSGYFIGLSYFTNNSNHLNLNYNHIVSSTKASFINGDSRLFDLILTYIQIEFDKGIEKEKYSLLFGFGGMIGSGVIDSYYQFSDGTYHFGIEKILNGQYKARLKALYLSVIPTYHITKKISIYAKIDGFHYFKPKSFYDEDASKINHTPHNDYIGTDYLHYADIFDHFSEIPEQYRLKTDMKGFNLSFGIKYLINEKNK